MTNNIGKILAIATTFLSVAFLGFAFVARVGGPNWEGDAEALEKYYVERTDNPKETTYNLKSKATGETVKPNTKVLPDAILAAYLDEAKDLDAKINVLTPQLEPLQTRLKEVQTHQAIDRKAMAQREQELDAEFAMVTKLIQEKSVEGDKVAQEALTLWAEGELRREDVYRLRNHLEELEVDDFQLREQKKRLQDELSRLRGVLARLQRRHEQLETAAASEK